MTVKEFLKKVRKQNEVIRAYESELKDLRIRAINISSPILGEKVQSNHQSSLDEIVEKIETQADKVNEAWSTFMEVRDQVASLINSEPDEYRRCVLYRYYILCQSWEQIAVEMHFSIRWITKLHGRALQDQDFSKTRIAPMIRDTRVLRDLFLDVKTRDSNNTILNKIFPGGRLVMAGANSPAGLASRPIRILLCDEVDRFPASAGTEGDPIDLAAKRMTTYWNRVMGMFSTPTNEGASRRRRLP